MDEPRPTKKLQGRWHTLFTDRKTGRSTWSRKQAHAIKDGIKTFEGASVEAIEITPTRWAVYYRHKYLAFDNLEHLLKPEVDR